MRPVVTVTLNPAIDRTVWIDDLVPGTTHRTADTMSTIGGKGINVARSVAAAGLPAHAIGIAGGDQAAAIEHHLASLGVTARFLPTDGETRTNLKLIERATGRLTEINGRGPVVGSDLVADLEATLLRTVADTSAAVVVLAGSLPVGVDARIYARWTELLREHEPPVAVLADASDEALAHLVQAGPFLVKPNRVEAEGLVGAVIDGADAAAASARAIAAQGPRLVLLSLGAQGAVAATADAVEVLPVRPIDAPNGHRLTTVGAGDAMVARMAIELAQRGVTDGVGTTELFAMCRLAVDGARDQIAAGARPDNEPSVVALDQAVDGHRPAIDVARARRP